MANLPLVYGLAVFMYFVANVKAYQVCRSLTETLTCEDSGASVGYCCGQHTVLEDIPKCCFRTQWWGRWYIWFAVSIGLSLLIAFIRVCARASRTTSNQTPPYSRMETPARSDMRLVPDNDLPPSYQQVVAGSNKINQNTNSVPANQSN